MMYRHSLASKSFRRWLVAAALGVSASLFASPLAAQTGIVTGRVTDAASGAPVANAQVMVVGTTIGAAVGSDGQFRITGVPAGSRQIRARSIGYEPATATVSVGNGATATVNIRMNQSATALDAVVVTGAVGDTRRRAIGNAVATVSVAEELDRASLSNISEVLQAKTPGLTLVPGSGVGTGSNYRLPVQAHSTQATHQRYTSTAYESPLAARATSPFSDRKLRRSTPSTRTTSSPSRSSRVRQRRHSTAPKPQPA